MNDTLGLMKPCMSVSVSDPTVALSLIHSGWSALQMAKFLYHNGSTSQPAEGDKPYGDLLVVKELRKLQNSNRKAAK